MDPTAPITTATLSLVSGLWLWLAAPVVLGMLFFVWLYLRRVRQMQRKEKQYLSLRTTAVIALLMTAVLLVAAFFVYRNLFFVQG
jgi:heme/copper-type cytochrome/quinol oxidase subunit 2